MHGDKYQAHVSLTARQYPQQISSFCSCDVFLLHSDSVLRVTLQLEVAAHLSLEGSSLAVTNAAQQCASCTPHGAYY